MKIRSVRAHPFGPVADDELSFGPGFTVVHGPNESGKSSWHVATTTALTGIRKGRPRKAEKLFAERHRPWQHDGWAVSCVLDLDDGRSVRLLHNLARGTAQAIDEATGADITEAFASAGGVDAAQLIGLDRDTLPLVASVRQAEILQLAAAAASDDNVSALRGFLQQSVSSRAASDSTAEVALDRLARFAADAIGTEKRGSAKPLRQAGEAAERATAEVAHCRAAWEAHHHLQVELDDVERQSQKVEQQILRARLAQAEQKQADAEAELAAAQSLADAAASAPVSTFEPQQIEAVREALVRFEQHDGGLSAEPVDALAVSHVRAELAALPEAPSGDIEPRSAIVDLQAAVRASTAMLDAHAAVEPEAAVVVPTGAGADALRSFAAELDTAVPEVPSEPVDQHLHGEANSTTPARLQGRLAVVAGLALCLCAVALIAASASSTVILGLFGLGAALAIAGGYVLSQPDRPSPEALARQAHAQAEAQLAVAAAKQAQERRAAVLDELQRRQLPRNADELRLLATQADRSALAADARAAWHARWQVLADRVEADSQQLHDQLVAVGLEVLDVAHNESLASAVLQAADHYVESCRHRREQSTAAAKRPALEARLQSLADAEQRHAAIRLQQQAVETDLETATVAVGLPSDGHDHDNDVAALAHQARQWLRSQQRAQAGTQRGREAAAQLDGLLAGRSIADLERATVDAAAHAEQHRQVLAARNLPAATTAPVAAAGLRRLEANAAVHADRASELRGRLSEAASSLEPLAQVLERHQRVTAEYERLQRLDGLVRQTSTFLEQAREHLHRDIAPGIAEATKHRLATVSAGRYKEIRVNPDDLSVQVQLPDGGWRLAEQLSHGTAEQVYLLVRAAIAEIVAPDIESCPLILDDVTVHADRERTIAMLETLEELSHDRQVILFSQEIDVIDWAEQMGVNVVRLPAT